MFSKHQEVLTVVYQPVLFIFLLWHHNMCVWVCVHACVCVEVEVLVTQLCLILCDPMNCTSVHGILQATILQWVAIPFSSGSCWPKVQIQVSCLQADCMCMGVCISWLPSHLTFLFPWFYFLKYLIKKLILCFIWGCWHFGKQYFFW